MCRAWLVAASSTVETNGRDTFKPSSLSDLTPCLANQGSNKGYSLNEPSEPDHVFEQDCLSLRLE